MSSLTISLLFFPFLFRFFAQKSVKLFPLKTPLRRSCQSFDNVYFWIYNEELEQGYLSNAVYRRMQKASVALPDAFFAGGTPALHVYAFVQDAQGRCSETAYAGVAGFSGISGDSEFSGGDRRPGDGRDNIRSARGGQRGDGGYRPWVQSHGPGAAMTITIATNYCKRLRMASS